MKNLCICIRLCTCKIIRAILTQSPRIFTIRIRTSCKVRRKKQLSTRTHKLFAIDSIDCICDCRFRLIAAFICNIAILYITALSRTIPSGMCPPTTHLDSHNIGFDCLIVIQEMRSLIASMPQTTGATVLISSHLLGEIEQMVDQVGILNHGKLLFEGSLQQLQKHSRGGILLRVLDAPKAAAVLQQQGVKATVPADQPDTLQLPPLPDEALAALVCTLAERGVGVVGLTAQTKSLEDIFLSLTQTSGEVA